MYFTLFKGTGKARLPAAQFTERPNRFNSSSASFETTPRKSTMSNPTSNDTESFRMMMQRASLVDTSGGQDTQSWTAETNLNNAAYATYVTNVNNLSQQYPLNVSPSQTAESSSHLVTPTRKKSTDSKTFGSIFGLGRIKLRREVPRNESASGSLRRESNEATGTVTNSSDSPIKEANIDNTNSFVSTNSSAANTSKDRRVSETTSGYEQSTSQSNLRNNLYEFFDFNRRYTKSKNFITGSGGGRSKQRMSSLSIELDENNNEVVLRGKDQHGMPMSLQNNLNPSITQEIQKRLDHGGSSMAAKQHSLSTKTINTTTNLSSKPPLPISSNRGATAAANANTRNLADSLLTATSLDDKYFRGDEASTSTRNQANFNGMMIGEHANNNRSRDNVFDARFEDHKSGSVDDLGEADETSSIK
jgi:hypothetical protein